MTEIVVPEAELTSLVRRWMATRGRAESRRAAPPGRPHEVKTRPGITGAGDARDRRSGIATVSPLPVDHASPGSPGEPARARSSQPPTSERAGRGLPRRVTGLPRPTSRLAVLIDARATSPDSATALLERLADRGAVSVCRAYADWAQPDLGEWVTRLRDHGLQSFHHLADDQEERALVAMVIDAVDIAREAAVDTVVLAGHLQSALPLVHRLHVSGLEVVAVGPAHTPHDVRAACDEFWDFDSLAEAEPVPGGRHRA